MTTLRLLTWNIWGKNADWQARETALLTAITETNPDIITVQEAWNEPDGTTQTARLSNALRLNHHVQADPPAPIRHRGLGVISRWPITTHDTLTLPAAGEPDEHRIALAATITTPAGNLPLINTHLNWRPDHSAVRQVQVRHLAEVAAQTDYGRWPTVLCGDFNAVPESDEIRMLTGLTNPPYPASSSTTRGPRPATAHPATPGTTTIPTPPANTSAQPASTTSSSDGTPTSPAPSSKPQ